jgi:hypothetical protein
MKNEPLDTAQASTVAEQAPHVAPEKAPSAKATTQKNAAPKGRQTANGAKPKKGAKAGKKQAKAKKKTAQPARAKSTARAKSKGAKILGMVGRGKGATLAEIRKATGWQAHSVRGFISTAGKRHGVKIESSKTAAGDRVYKMAK